MLIWDKNHRCWWKTRGTWMHVIHWSNCACYCDGRNHSSFILIIFYRYIRIYQNTKENMIFCLLFWWMPYWYVNMNPLIYEKFLVKRFPKIGDKIPDLSVLTTLVNSTIKYNGRTSTHGPEIFQSSNAFWARTLKCGIHI